MLFPTLVVLYIYISTYWSVCRSVLRLIKGWTVRGSNSGGGEIFRPSRPALGVYPVSCTMGTGSFRGVKCGRGVTLTTHPLLAPRYWKIRAILLPPLGHNRTFNGVILPWPFTYWSICSVPKMAVFCISLILCFSGMLLDIFWMILRLFHLPIL